MSVESPLREGSGLRAGAGCCGTATAAPGDARHAREQGQPDAGVPATRRGDVSPDARSLEAHDPPTDCRADGGGGHRGAPERKRGARLAVRQRVHAPHVIGCTRPTAVLRVWSMSIRCAVPYVQSTGVSTDRAARAMSHGEHEAEPGPTRLHALIGLIGLLQRHHLDPWPHARQDAEVQRPLVVIWRPGD